MKNDPERTGCLSEIGFCSAAIAHELRNPLGAMKIALFNMKRENKNPALNKHIAHIEHKISESDQIISALLDYSQEKTPKYQAISPVDILDACIADCQKKHGEWNVSIQKRYGCSRDDFIEADPEHITQIFSNILTNMFQAFPDKKGHVTIELDLKQEREYCRIMFQDNGVGIEEEDLSKIFDPFFTAKARGIGLGLSICRQLVGLHSGKISAVSTIGVGTKIYVNLPVKQNKQERGAT